MKGDPNTVTAKFPRISGPKKILFILLIFFILWAIFDTGLYLFLRKIQRKIHLFQRPLLPSNEQIEDFAKRFFHPKWGWDIAEEQKGKLGNRKKHNYPNKDIYKMKVFGDSFTYGFDVENDETWEHFVEENTGWECLNFGVPGYGTDQALLKYIDIDVKTEYTILAILDENIARVMTHWWGFYAQKGFQTKPKFSISDSNSIVLVDNPIRCVDDIMQLQDINFINQVGKDDYWCAYSARLNRPTKLTWPTTFLIAAHRDFFAKYIKINIKSKIAPSFESEMARRKFFHLYSKTSEGLRIMRYIVDEFVSTANKREETPIILIFPFSGSIDIMKRFGKKPYGSLIEYLEASGYNFIDVGDVFVEEQYSNYYQMGDGHFSIDGNRRVAAVLVDYIRQLEQK